MTPPRLARLVTLAAAAAAIALVLAGCTAAEGRRIDVIGGDRSDGTMYFEPRELTVAPGETVTFYVRNDGTGDHEFESDEAGIDEVVVPRGRMRKVTWKAPKSGDYPVYCDITGHRAAGMELTIHVVAP